MARDVDGMQQATQDDPLGRAGAHALQQTRFSAFPGGSSPPPPVGQIIPTIPHCQPFHPTFHHQSPHGSPLTSLRAELRPWQRVGKIRPRPEGIRRRSTRCRLRRQKLWQQAMSRSVCEFLQMSTKASRVQGSMSDTAHIAGVHLHGHVVG